MDSTVQLLNEIQRHRYLYDPSHECYKNIFKKKNAWLEISTKMGIPIDECRYRWRQMRDTYVKKSKITTSSSTDNLSKKWIYYDAMGFLKPYTRKKRTLTNFARRNTTNIFERSTILGIQPIQSNQGSTSDCDPSSQDCTQDHTPPASTTSEDIKPILTTLVSSTMEIPTEVHTSTAVPIPVTSVVTAQPISTEPATISIPITSVSLEQLNQVWPLCYQNQPIINTPFATAQQLPSAEPITTPIPATTVDTPQRISTGKPTEGVYQDEERTYNVLDKAISRLIETPDSSQDEIYHFTMMLACKIRKKNPETLHQLMRDVMDFVEYY